MTAATVPIEPEEPHGTSIPTPHHGIPYYAIFFALVALTIITVLIAMYRFQNELANVAIALLVASVKATFVARYFMHLKFEGKLIYLILFVPLGLTVILICALIPDVTMTHPDNNTTSLHINQNPALNE